jgi:phage replication initiation protein
MLDQGSDVADALVAEDAPAPGLCQATGELVEDVAPPPTNRGAQNTGVILDWLSGTFPVAVTLEDALGFLAEDVWYKGTKCDIGWSPMVSGAMGYKSGVSVGEMKVFYDGGEGMGVHFVFSGRGVRKFLGLSNIETEEQLRAWLERAVGRGVSFTRCDWACDDRSVEEPLLDLDVIREAAKGPTAVSRFKVAEERRTYALGKRRGPKPMKEELDLLSDAFYFGSIYSEVSVCFYDKAKEQLAKARKRLLPGETVREAQVPERWIRCELRAKKKHAQALVKAFVEKGRVGVLSALLNYLDFRDTSDSNVTRCKRVWWWDKFIEEVKRQALVIEKSTEDTVERVRRWMFEQVAPMFSVLWDLGHHGGFVQMLVKHGQTKRTDKHREIINRERSRGRVSGVEPLSCPC